MLVLNIGSRDILHEFSNNDEEYKRNIILRRFAIFAVCFIGTRDITHSLLLTAAFVVLASGLHHSKSIYAREGMDNRSGHLPASAGVVVASNY